MKARKAVGMTKQPYPLACTDCRWGIVFWLADVAVQACRFCLERWAWEVLVLVGNATA